MPSIFDTMSVKEKRHRPGRREFLREILVCGLLGLALPGVALGGMAVHGLTDGAAPAWVAIGTGLILFVVAVPVTVLAMFRLNAAAVARERAVMAPSEPVIHPPLQGPLLLRRSMVAGSARSRIVAGLPGSIGFCAVFAIIAAGTGQGVFILPFVLLGIVVACQAVTAAWLLRRGSVSARP
jgi:hypothetical protein